MVANIVVSITTKTEMEIVEMVLVKQNAVSYWTGQLLVSILDGLGGQCDLLYVSDSISIISSFSLILKGDPVPVEKSTIPPDKAPRVSASSGFGIVFLADL